VKVLIVDKTKCTGCHQCELWCGTEISSVSKELARAINEEPQPVPRVYVEGKQFALQCRHCENAPCLEACPNGRCEEIRDRVGICQRTHLHCLLDVCHGMPFWNYQSLRYDEGRH